MYLRSLREIERYVENIVVAQDEQLMIMVADQSSNDVEKMMQLLNDKGIHFFGGIFPGLLSEASYKTTGFIVEKIQSVYSSLVLPNLLVKSILQPEVYMDDTAILMVDGLSDRFQELTDTVYKKLGKNVRYIGGGAGSYNLNQKPCIFTNKGIFQDVLHICITKSKVHLAVKHGWKKLDGPFTVDKSEGNVLSEIDGYNAFEIYRDVIEKTEGLRLFKEDFFIYAKDHPFGIQQEDTSIVVRDPIAVNDNDEIVLVASIPKESQVYVLKGDVNSLLSSSYQIAEDCSSKAPERYIPLLFDCITRAMFLEDRFEEELANIQAKMEYPVEGALSIGEIASKRNGSLVIHNKSTVLGLLSNARSA